MDTSSLTNEDISSSDDNLDSKTINPLELPDQINNEIVILDSEEEDEAKLDPVQLTEVKSLNFEEDIGELSSKEKAEISSLIDFEENKLIEQLNQEIQDDVIEIQDDDTESSEISPISKEFQLAAPTNTVQIIRYYYRNEEISLDLNHIVLYCKKIVDTRVAAYKGHEYERLPTQNKDEQTWRCSKSTDCPALLIIGKRGSNNAYEVDEHNCVDSVDTLDQSLLKKGYALVNVLYYEGNNVLDAFFNLDKTTLVLFGAHKAFYDTYEYVKSVATKDFFEYGCSAPCEAFLRLSRKGIDKKMVLVISLHTCKSIRRYTNRHPVASEAIDLPEKFTGVRRIKYETLEELAFCLKVDELFPPAGLPILYFNNENDQKSVYFRQHNYSLSFVVNKHDRAYNICKCKTKYCSGQLDVTSDYLGVLEVGVHICDNPEDRKISDVYTLIKLSKLSDRYDDDGEVTIIEKTKLRSGYVQAKFKYVNNLRDCVSSNDDAETVLVYSGQCTSAHVQHSRNVQQLCYYKGYSYRYSSLQLRICSRSMACAASLIVREDLSQVKEIGEHTCKNSSTQEIPCPALTPILPVVNDNAEATPDKIDTLHYNLVNIKNYIGHDLNVAQLNPQDKDTAYVYLAEVGRRPIIYYKGHTYHYSHKSRIIYLCSKSRGCSAALKPHDTNRYELAEVGEHNCNLLSDNNYCMVSLKSKPIKFVIVPARDFNLVPNFDPNDHNIVTMLVSDVRLHNIVYYKGYTYVDDRSLSCDRGQRVTRKSCNLLYMCVKSNKCSAGLSTDIDRTTVLEVGLHNCLNTVESDDDKLFKELKPVSFFYKNQGKPDNLDVCSSDTVITYMENKRKAAFYNGYTYIDRVNGCSSPVGCKCLYMCDKRPDCTAAILVDARHAVLEVGLHSCKKIEEGVTNVVYFTPVMFQSASFFNTSGYGGTLKLPADATASQSTGRDIAPKKKRSISMDFSDTLKKAKGSLKIINHTKHKLKKVPFKDQIVFTELNPTLINFRGYVHEKSTYSNHYNCIHKLSTNCAGELVVFNSRTVQARKHICQEVQREKLSSNYVFIYFNQSLREELLYKGLTYLRNSKSSVIWICTNYSRCNSFIKLQENTVEEFAGGHTCTNTLLKESLISPLTIRSRFTSITRQRRCYPPTVPVLDEKDQLCLIHLGYIYAYTSHKVNLDETVLSEWTCIQVTCPAVLRLKCNKVAAVSQHHCFLESVLAKSPENHTVNSISVDEFPPIQVFKSDRSTYLMCLGYLYQSKGLKPTTENYTLKCINAETINCWGTLIMKDNNPIAVSKHSCRKLIPAGDLILQGEIVECDDITIKEEDIQEIDLDCELSEGKSEKEETDAIELMDSDETLSGRESIIADDEEDTNLNHFYTSHQTEFVISDVTGGYEIADEDSNVTGGCEIVDEDSDVTGECEIVDEDPINDDKDNDSIVVDCFNLDEELDIEDAIPASVVMMRKNPS